MIGRHHALVTATLCLLFGVSAESGTICFYRFGGIVRKCFHWDDESEKPPSHPYMFTNVKEPVAGDFYFDLPEGLAPGAFGDNGPVIANAVGNLASTVSQAMAGFAKADFERSVRYQPQTTYSGLSAAQKTQQHEAFHRDLEEKQRRAMEEINKPAISPKEKQEVGDSFQRILEKVSEVNKRVKAHIASKQPKYAKVPEPEIIIPVEFETEGLSDEQIEYLQLAASEAALLKTGDNAYELGSERWTDRFQRAQRYWNDEKLRAIYAKVKLSQTAKNRFQLPEIQSDSFENYEIISAANQLSRDREMVSPFRRTYISLTLNQAYQFAQEGDFYASSKMLENALSDRDFAHGAVKGLYQNVYDTVTGLWHLVRHPIESAKALAHAIVNFEQTFEIIADKLSKIATEFPYYDAEKKGEVLGYLATEIFMAIGTGGGSLAAEVGKIAKVSEAVAIATEEALKTLNALKNINRFEVAFTALSDAGKANVEFLRAYAKRNNYVLKPNPLGGPEEWGVIIEEKFRWRVKIKPEASTRIGLEAESQVPRAAVRLEGNGLYFNPFTGQTGGREIGAHIGLEHNWGI